MRPILNDFRPSCQREMLTRPRKKPLKTGGFADTCNIGEAVVFRLPPVHRHRPQAFQAAPQGAKNALFPGG